MRELQAEGVELKRWPPEILVIGDHRAHGIAAGELDQGAVTLRQCVPHRLLHVKVEQRRLLVPTRKVLVPGHLLQTEGLIHGGE